jgi:hypothetical protein
MASSSASATSLVADSVRVLTNSEARRLLLARQGLSGERAKGLAGLIHALGYVQLDSIRIVERAHHHILFSRDLTYRPRSLERLYAKERALFEHWTHDASLIPIAFYPHWHHRFDAHRERITANTGWWRERLGGRETVDAMRAHVEREGPVRARDIETKEGRSGSWWGWGKHKAALEFLWFTGELAIARRDGFEKIYDLAERVIPEAHRAKRPSAKETLAWACDSALERLGAATQGEIADFWSLASREDVAAWAARERRAHRLIEIGVSGVDGKVRPALARPGLLEELGALPAPPGRLRLLSPFDPVLRNRQRTERLFGFDYRIEIFTPAAKRRYGYYVFPILEGDRFTGRIDLKADRAMDRLLVQGLWLEPGITLSKSRRARLMTELARQARLADVATIEFPESAIRARTYTNRRRF